MSEHDESLERLIQALKRPAIESQTLRRRVMAQVLAEGRLIKPRPWGFFTALAMTVGLAAIAVTGIWIRGRSQGVAFTLSAPYASTVTLVGDFNDWDPKSTPLTHVDGAWSVRVRLRPGLYNYAFVVDGSRWLSDPTAPNVHVDDFGSPNSVITVAGGSL